MGELEGKVAALANDVKSLAPAAAAKPSVRLVREA